MFAIFAVVLPFIRSNSNKSEIDSFVSEEEWHSVAKNYEGKIQSKHLFYLIPACIAASCKVCFTVSPTFYSNFRNTGKGLLHSESKDLYLHKQFLKYSQIYFTSVYTYKYKYRHERTCTHAYKRSCNPFLYNITLLVDSSRQTLNMFFLEQFCEK